MLRRWDLHTGGATAEALHAHRAPVCALALDADGSAGALDPPNLQPYECVGVEVLWVAVQATSLCRGLVSQLHPYVLRLCPDVLQAASRSRAPRTVRCAAGVPTTPPFAASHTRRYRRATGACSHWAFRRVASPHRSPPTACCRCPPYVRGPRAIYTALHVTLQVPSACAACALAHAPHIHTIHAACPLQAWAWAGGSGTLRRRNSGCAEAGEGEGGAGGEGGGEGEGAPLRAAALAVSHGAGLALTVAAASCAVRVWQLGGGGSGGGSGGSGAGVGGGGGGGDGGRPSLACEYVSHAPQHVVAVAACEGFPLAASTSGGDIHVWALRDGTPVARLLGEGSPWTACALHGGALLTGAYAGVLGLFHLGGLVQQLDGAAVALEPAATRAAAGEVPAAGKAAAGLADADAARVSHDSAELVGDEAEDAAAEALQVQDGGGGT